MITGEEQKDILGKRIQGDERLDILYMTEMRCPYCQTKMLK